jgi:hypothetical protein
MQLSAQRDSRCHLVSFSVLPVSVAVDPYLDASSPPLSVFVLGSVLTSLACQRRQIGAPVVARGRAHQDSHRHLACRGRLQWVWMSRTSTFIFTVQS